MMKDKFVKMCRRVLSAMACVTLVCGVLAGCGGAGEKDGGDGNADSSAQSEQVDRLMSQFKGRKLAPSLEAYIDQAIESMETDPTVNRVDPTGEGRRRTIQTLRAAKERGGVTVSEYESAWSDYKQCMLDRGYKEIVLVKLSNGLYHEALHRTGTPEQETRYGDDNTYCMAMNVFGITGVYEVQVANPDLYQNQFEGILDCFRRNEAVPKSYSMDDLRHDLFDATSPDELIINFDSPDVQACLVGNNMYVDTENQPREELW